MTPIRVVVQFQIKDSCVEVVEKQINDLVLYVNENFPRSISYEHYFSKVKPNQGAIIETWESREALDEYMLSHKMLDFISDASEKFDYINCQILKEEELTENCKDKINTFLK